MERKAFYAGSFDPFTKGHLAIVCEALCAFDEVIIGVGVNSSKQTLFDCQQREYLIASSIDDFTREYRHRELNGRSFTANEAKAAYRLLNEASSCLKIISYEGITIDAAINNGATALIRGERIVGDHDSEMALASVNRELLAIRKTHLDMLVIPVPNVSQTYISSSVVKNLCSLGEYIAAQRYVMPSVHQALMEKYLYQCCPYPANVRWADICWNYSAKNRSYHNLSHIGYCLNYANIYANVVVNRYDNLTLSEEEKTSLYAAIFYHDYICMGKDDDEARSIAAAKDDLIASCFDLAKIERLIMMTRHRGNYVDADPVSRLIHDVDLAILGDRDNYGMYAMQVRCEYSRYDTESYALGRSEVLKRLLDSDYLYLTEFFGKEFSENAKFNMKHELAFWQERL